MLYTQGMDFGATVALLSFVFVPSSPFWGPKSKAKVCLIMKTFWKKVETNLISKPEILLFTIIQRVCCRNHAL